MESRKRDPTFCGPVNFWKRSQPRPWRPVIAPDRKPFVSDQKTHGISVVRSTILRTCEFLEAISAAPMAPRYGSRSEAFSKRSENSWSLARATQNFADLYIFGSDPSRAHGAPFLLQIGSLWVSDQKTYGISRARSNILRTCNILEAISAAPIAPRYCSRSEAVFCFFLCFLSAIRKFMESQERDPKLCGPSFFWKRSQPRPWRPVVCAGRKPFCKRSEHS